MDIIQVNSSSVEKSLRYIKSLFSFDSHKSVQIAPFGDDSCPPNGTKGIKGKSTTSAIHVVFGYFNRNPQAKPGEKRLYSVKEDGTDSFYIHLKNDETFEIGGADGFLISYDHDNKKLIIDTSSEGTIELTGNLIVNGSIEAAGEVTAMTEDGLTQVSLSTHKHTSPVGPTNKPIPLT